jgi:hypothetical protein
MGRWQLRKQLTEGLYTLIVSKPPPPLSYAERSPSPTQVVREDKRKLILLNHQPAKAQLYRNTDQECGQNPADQPFDHSLARRPFGIAPG